MHLQYCSVLLKKICKTCISGSVHFKPMMFKAQLYTAQGKLNEESYDLKKNANKKH